MIPQRVVSGRLAEYASIFFQVGGIVIEYRGAC